MIFLKKNKLLFLILILITSACGSINKEIHQESEFIHFIKKFDALYNTDVLGNMSMVFVNNTSTPEVPNAIGWCYWATNNRHIEINNSWWIYATYNQREALIFHELGHCALNRAHTSETMDFNGREIPISIMNPFMFANSNFYTVLKDHYFLELWTGRSDMFINIMESDDFIDFKNGRIF